MPYITVGKENSGNIELYYEDHGSGNRLFDPRIPIERCFLGKQFPPSMRVIGSSPMTAEASASPASRPQATLRHVRRGTSQAGHPPQAARFHISRLFDGGGEVARYIGKYGSKGVSKSRDYLRCATVPAQDRRQSRRRGCQCIAGIEKAVAGDRYAFFTGFFRISTTLTCYWVSVSVPNSPCPAAKGMLSRRILISLPFSTMVVTRCART